MEKSMLNFDGASDHVVSEEHPLGKGLIGWYTLSPSQTRDLMGRSHAALVNRLDVPKLFIPLEKSNADAR
jgi:hypothetical protein